MSERARDQGLLDAQPANVAGDLPSGHGRLDPQRWYAGGGSSEPASGQTRCDAQCTSAAGDLTSGHRSDEAHFANAGGNGASDRTCSDAQGSPVLAPDPYALLVIDADAVDDLERIRIATENRIRSLAQFKGLEGSPEERRARELLTLIQTAERHAIRSLERSMRAHPLGDFVQRTRGLGCKQAARLLAATGDPGARPNVAKLWAYCGFHVIDGQRPRRRRGEQANWSNDAKMRARLIAESRIKQMRSPYRPVYDRERAKWAERDTSDLHKHNHALSVVAKEVLKDLWREARGLKADEDQWEGAPPPAGELVPA